MQRLGLPKLFVQLPSLDAPRSTASHLRRNLSTSDFREFTSTLSSQALHSRKACSAANDVDFPDFCRLIMVVSISHSNATKRMV